MPLRPLRPREVIDKLERAGFHGVRQRGSHLRLVNVEGRGVTVPMHPGDVPLNALRSVLRQAGLSEEEWERL
ncbi:MAG: type II toxin-antitoxin system HicA family toxin [Chloroflexi bacterium]|nr:type II toxin-antitoxin system HicA family toxin [Chloroflexota bacterium]